MRLLDVNYVIIIKYDKLILLYNYKKEQKNRKKRP